MTNALLFDLSFRSINATHAAPFVQNDVSFRSSHIFSTVTNCSSSATNVSLAFCVNYQLRCCFLLCVFYCPSVHVLHDGKVPLSRYLPATYGCGSKLSHQVTAGFRPWFHLPGVHWVPIFDPQPYCGGQLVSYAANVPQRRDAGHHQICNS